MKRPRIITEGSRTFLRLHTEKNELLDPRRADILIQGKVDGLIPVQIVPKGKTCLLLYDVTGYMLLESYLKSGLRRAALAALLRDIYETLRDLRQAFFCPESMLLSPDRVFLRPGSRKASFIFVPVQQYAGGQSVRDFYLSIAREAVLSPGESTAYVEELIALLKCGVNLSMFDLEEYIRKLSETPMPDAPKNRCKKCHAVNRSASSFCASCGTPLHTEEQGRAVYDPLAAEKAPKPILNGPAPENAGPCPETGPAEPSEQRAPLRKAWMLQKRTGSAFPVETARWTVGKSGCDCCISDNPVVSRVHAELLQREGRFFVVDLCSTNRTYVNGQPVPAQSEVELQSGFLLRFGNEDFEFRL